MHSTKIDDLIFHHEGDYYGDVEITDAISGESVCVLPFETLKRFVAGYVKQKRISALEDASADELLLK